MAGSSGTYSNGGVWGCFKNLDLDFDSDQSRIQAAAAQHNRGQHDSFAQDGYQDGGSASYLCPSQCHWHSSSNTNHSCSNQWCGPLSDLALAPTIPDNMGKFKSSHVRPPSNVPFTPDSTWDRSLAGGFMDSSLSKGDAISEDAGVDDDMKSDCMSCAESCSSHCGETGHGSICCDDQGCEEQESCTEGCESHDPCADDCPGSEPCVDQDCEAARTPCMDETCFAQTPPAEPARREEAAAAQALTSFHDQTDGSLFSGDTSFLDSLSFDGDHAFMEGSGSGIDFGAGNGHFTEFDNSMNGLSQSNISGNGQLPAQTPALEFTTEFYRHILNFHQPNSLGHSHCEHVRPCIADHPALKGQLCPLPNMDASQSQFNYMDSVPDCQFTIQSAPGFVDHLRSHHEPLLPQLAGWSRDGSGSNFQAFQQGAQNYNQQFFGSQCQGNNSFDCQGFLGNPHTGFTQAHHYPTPGSAATVPSLMSTPLPTPDSTTTSPSVDTFQKSGGYGLPQPNLKLEVTEPPTPQANSKGQGRSMGPDDAFRCYWQDHKSGQACLQNFADSDALDAHCKSAHTKDLPKIGAGFQCSWQGCKRTHDSFTTRAKLNRHLQTHTGYKPMKCPHCGLRLSAKQALDQHIRTHTGEHPYECKYGCGQKFKQHSALTMHHRVHTKEKPLSCTVCGAKFTESSNLSKHMRTHSVKGHFDCDLCDKNFHRLDQLRRHLHTNHKDQPEAVVGNIERAKDWKKKVNREKRANMGTAQESSLEPLTESSDTNLDDLDLDADEV